MTRRLAGLVALVLAVWFSGIFVRDAFFGSPRAAATVDVTISEGTTAAEAGRELVRAGAIDRSWSYRLLAWFDETARRPKPGTYRIRPGTSLRSIARLLAIGPARNESRVTIIEGWTVDDLAGYLLEEKGIAPEATAALTGRTRNRSPFRRELRERYAFLKDLPGDRSLEGYLFPETYRVWDDQLPEGLVEKQLQEFERRFGSIRVMEKSAPLTTVDQVVTLASIVEKEVRLPEDRRRVAGIFLRRLRIGMPLQSDATLTYLTGSSRTRATAADLALESPYNSYKYKGLPPSPICNPAESAIRAVLDPDDRGELFFLADRDGNVLYAKTLEGHAENRRKAGY
jgi:UPF0755 protein